MNQYFKPRQGWFLLGICSLFILLRIPSLIEPHWYGDEGIYQVVGRSIVQGRTLYQQIWDNKPPLLYIIYALANGNLYAIKILSLLSGLASIGAFYILTGKLFKKLSTRYLSTTIYAVLFGLPIIEGNIANAENFMLLPTILAGFYLLSYIQYKKYQFLVISGILLSFALATKIVALFDFFAFLTFLLLFIDHSKLKLVIKPIAIYALAFLSVITICAIYFIYAGAFYDFLNAVFLQNVSYVGEENKFIFPMGGLILKSIILSGFIGFIFIKSKSFPKSTTFIYLWTSFAVYSAFFSDRPYTHYLLLILPAFSLLFANMLENKKNRVVELIALIVIMFFAYFHFKIYTKSIEYYNNFRTFMTTNRSVIEYESFFDRNTPRDYSISSFIDMNVLKNESVFLWSDSPQIYALSNKLPIGKYIVAYHIKFYKNADVVTKEQIEVVKPKYIIQTVDGQMVNEILSSYKLRYIMNGTKIYEREI